jgi:hypothetical protein
MPKSTIRQIKIERISSLEPVKSLWDSVVTDYFQTYAFTCHLEKFNNCSQRYYVLYENEVLKSGAIMYTLPVNILTFSKKSLSVKMNVIGVAASVDSSGLIGDQKYFDKLINHILENEKGIILCLNYDSKINNKYLIQLNALPTIIFKHNFVDFKSYLENMRHHYRRRIIHSINKFEEVIRTSESCNLFTGGHYQLYLYIMARSKTKLEILSIDFFRNLSDNFMLTSYYNTKNELLIWHITCEFQNKYSFLFGGINYEKRDEFDAYYNNLIGIINEGIDKGCKTINLGQTAEVPKMRVGGERISKRMFLYHRNLMIRGLFKIFSKQLEYKCNSETLKVFKNENTLFQATTSG